MQNFIFISPNFPTNYWQFCRELKNNGLNVLGIGDQPYEELKPELKASLNEYYKVNSLENYDEVYRAVAFFTFKYGRIDWLESNNEYWLERDAALRTDFHITSGFQTSDMPRIKYKSKMKEYYQKAGIATARYHMVDDLAGCKAFVEQVGYPVVVKPDNGVGASDTHRLSTDKELEDFLAYKEKEHPDVAYIMEEFVRAEVNSYDAIIDAHGNPIFEAGNVSPVSIMDIVNNDDNSIYYIIKDLPEDTRAAGRAAVKSFGVKSRFVHFEFFRMNKGKATANMIAVQRAIFSLKFEMSYKLQDIQYQTDNLRKFRNTLVEDMSGKVRELNKDNFAVRQHLKYVELYSAKDNYQTLTYADTLAVRDELAPLIEPENDDAKALRFDALMYGIELAYLAGKKYSRGKHDLIGKVSGIAKVSNIPEITAQTPLIDRILHTDYLERADVDDFEHIRKSLRDLMKYVPKEFVIFETTLDDEVLSVEWKESELENDDLKDYKAKAEFYIREHQDESAIAKLKGNIPLNSDDIKKLEKILWSDLGTKADYEAEYGEKPLGEFVREIVGLDMNAAKAAFSEYLDSANLDSRQIYFVNQIVEYIVQNGMMKDLTVLQDSPFTDQGSIVEIFTDLSVWMGIRKVIDQVNANAAA